MLTFSASNPWSTLSPSDGSGNDLSPTAELDPLLSHLSTTLAFLSRVLAPAPLRRIARAVLATINSTLYDSVLRVGFSTQGAAQLNADLAAICAVVDEQIGARVAAIALRRCLEAATLVGLPVTGAKPPANPSVPADDDAMEEWDAWAGEDANIETTANSNSNTNSNTNTTTDVNADAGADPQKATSPSPLGLWDVEKRLFADNQSARDVLDQLGFDVLDEKEARRLLRLRVELAG